MHSHCLSDNSMKSAKNNELEYNSIFDPEVDLSKCEQGFVNLVDLIREDSVLRVPDNMRSELQELYNNVLNKNPQLVAEVINKLDARYRNDVHFCNAIKQILNDEDEMSLTEEEVGDVYYKSRMLGELMVEAEDYERAEAYLFVALKIKNTYAPETMDLGLLIDLAESIYSTIDSKKYKYDTADSVECKKSGELQKVLHKEKAKQTFMRLFHSNAGHDDMLELDTMTLEERLGTAKELLYRVVAEDNRNVEAFQLLAEIFIEYARGYINLVEEVYQKPVSHFSQTDINYVVYNFEEARTYALKSAIYEQEDEMQPLNLSLYTQASIQFALFLANTGNSQRAITIFQELLERNDDPIAVRDGLVTAMMPSLIVWKETKNGNLENHSRYIKLRDTARRYLKEIIHYVDYQMATPPDDNNLRMYIAAHYNNAILDLWDGKEEEACNAITVIETINHIEAKEWAEDLAEYIEDYGRRRESNPTKS